jgi:uncharacterized protein
MKIVLDTNVLISGIFWSGYPFQILEAWQKRKIKFAITEEIFDEYSRVARILSKKYHAVDIMPILELILTYAEMYPSLKLSSPVSSDPDDDKFIGCAISSESKFIVSGDADLLDIVEYDGIKIIKPKIFVENHLKLLR